jgi:hypothetical protein
MAEHENKVSMIPDEEKQQNRLFLHVIDGDVVEVTSFQELRSLPLYQIPEFSAFSRSARSGDVFQVQHHEYFVVLGITTRASWLG